jgi:ubiquinone/menaquinone biosynthesis C-methylase UbiE
MFPSEDAVNQHSRARSPTPLAPNCEMTTIVSSMRASGELPEHDWGSAPLMFGPRHDYRESLMLRLLLPAMPGPRVLNAGAGAGSMTLRMATLGLRTTSLDESPELCAHLESSLAERGIPGRHIVRVGDVSRLGLSDASFDAAVCGEVLEHVDDDRAALLELSRVLRPSGVLVVSVPQDPFRYDWTDFWAGHQRRYTADGLGQRLRDAGFEVSEVRSWGFPLSRVYHAAVFRPMLRRRLLAGPKAPGSMAAPPKLASKAARWVLELDSVAGGRGPGIGLIALARKPASSGPSG